MKIFVLFLIFQVLFQPFAMAKSSLDLSEQGQSHLIELQKKALQKKLSQHHQWRSLLHYHKRLYTNESTIDSDNFFLSNTGKKNLESELNATLESFFKPIEKGQDNKHNLCLFPARFHWLNEQLDINQALLPKPDCQQYETFKNTLDTETVSLIFTSAYMGNPASFFGHTLLRLDTQKKESLLSHAVNYGAATGNDKALKFIFNGVFGGYQGIFSVYPYYDTVNLYNNMENRDIWEYTLNLSKAQTNFLVQHIWELGQNSAEYYFFSENCSYMLLETLNVVLSDKDLTAGFYNPILPNYTIPVDTLRTVLLQNDVLKKVTYRPSRQTKLKNAYSHLSKGEKEQLRKLLKRPRKVTEVENSNLSNQEKANVLATSYDYLQYQLIAKKIEVDELRQESIKILNALNKTEKKSNIPAPPHPKTQPENGHKSGAVGLYWGQKESKDFVDLTLRPAYHTLLDETAGFLPFGQISYFETTLRWYENENDLELEKFKLVDIISLSPQDELFKPISFKVNLGIERYQYPTFAKDGNVFNASVAFGISRELKQNLIAYALLNGQAKLGGYLKHNSMAGFSGQFGIVADFDKVRLTSEVERLVYTQNDANIWKYEIETGISVYKNTSIEASYTFKDGKSNIYEGRIGLLFHF